MAEKKCNNCGTNNDMAVMPIAQHEKDQNHLMNIIKWLIAVILVLIVFSVGSNAFWIWRDRQYEVVEETTEETYTIDQDSETGNNNSVINGGEVVNGKTND